MLIYINEDPAYHSWVIHHRAGYVLDGLRTPSKRQVTIHRACCPAVRLSATKRTHWTTGRHFKACATQVEELIEWTRRETTNEPLYCDLCSPLTRENPQPLSPGQGRPIFPRLTREILEFVLETAIIHLDHRDSQYRLSAGEVARYLNKTLGQIAAGVFRLQAAGLLEIKQRSKKQLTESALLYPTVLGLQTLSLFSQESPQELAELVADLQKRGD